MNVGLNRACLPVLMTTFLIFNGWGTATPREGFRITASQNQNQFGRSISVTGFNFTPGAENPIGPPGIPGLTSGDGPIGSPTTVPFTSHSGNFIQGLFGSRGNFELVVPQSGRLTHYWRDNDTDGFPWHIGAPIPQIRRPISAPMDVELTQRTIGGATNPVTGNLLVILRVNDSLVHYSFDAETKQWNGPYDVKVDGRVITGVTGSPALIQNSDGNYDMLVPQGSQLTHWSTTGAEGDHSWYSRGSLPGLGGERPSLQPTPRSVALVQGNFNSPGNLEAIVRMKARRGQGEGDFLAFYFFDSSSQQWNGPFEIIADGQPITGVTGDPAFIQSTFGIQGNFELLVPQGDSLVHYFRDNDDSELRWRRSGSTVPAFGEIPGLRPTPTSVALVQGNFNSPGNLEAIVRMKPARRAQGEGDFLAFYFFDSGSRQWNGPFVIIADGQPITGVTGF